MDILLEDVDSQLATLQDYTYDLDELDKRDSYMSVGIENFNAYSEQCNANLISHTIPSFETLELGREGLGSLIRSVKDEILKLIRSIISSISELFKKFTSFTGRMIKGLTTLESEIEGDVVFNKDNLIEYDKLNEMNYLDGVSVESGMMDNIENIKITYNESIGDFIRVLDKMVKYQASYLAVSRHLRSKRIAVFEYEVTIKKLKSISRGRYGTPLSAILDKKFSSNKDAKFMHYAVFRTSKEMRLVLLDFKTCKKDKSTDEVCDKLKIIDADAKVIINRNNPMDTLKEADLRDLLTSTIKSMENYDPVDVEKAISNIIEDVRDRIKQSDGKNKRAISNLSVLVKYYAVLMRYSTTYIFNQHKMNYKSIKFLVHMSGD